MTDLVLRSWILLLRFEFVMLTGNFKTLHAIVRAEPLRKLPQEDALSADQICRAIDLACTFYFKEVLCLQRSAAATLLLRRNGFSADMVIGAQLLPFKSHAWVEVEEVTVNDNPYMRDIYQVLDRC